MGVQHPVESSICFPIVYAQKILSKLCSYIYEIQKKIVPENVKIYTLFSHFASVYGLCPWTQFGDFCSPDALAPPILDTSWSTSCETPPLWSPGYVQLITHPSLYPLKALGCGSQRHWGNVRSAYVGYCSSCYSQKNNVRNFSSKWHQCHQNCCLNKPYFMLKMQQIHNRVHTFHISLAVTHRERNLVVEIDKKI